MSTVRNLAEQRPYLFIVGLFIVQAVVTAPFVITFKVLGLDIVPLRLIIPIVQSALMVGVVAALGWYARSGFTRTVHDVHLYWYPTLLAFIPVLVYGTVAIPVSGVLFYMGAVFFTGVSEEAFARGLIIPALLPRGKWVALLVAGAIFSVSHLTNLFFEDFGVLKMMDVLLQTFGFAILYGALFLRTGNIWPLIVLHTIHDYSHVISGAAGPYKAVLMAIPLSISLSLLNIAYGVYIVRTVGRSPDGAMRSV